MVSPCLSVKVPPSVMVPSSSPMVYPNLSPVSSSALVLSAYSLKVNVNSLSVLTSSALVAVTVLVTSRSPYAYLL